MILVLTGTDDYRKRERRRAAIAEFGVKPDEVVTIDADTATIQQLDDALMSLGLFATKRVVYAPRILKDAPKPIRERLSALLATLDESTLLILDETNLDQRLDITKQLKKLATAEPVESLKGIMLERWVGDTARTFGVTIEPPARAELVARVGEHTWQLASELEKLAAAALNESPPRISVSLVKEITPATVSTNSFALTDALVAGNVAKARLALAKLAQQGEEPIRLMGLVAYHLRTLVFVKDAFERGTQPKLAPFVAKKHLSLAQRISWTTLSQWYTTLAAYDEAVKTGRIEAVIALELMVHALTT